MFTETIHPRFAETDALGHINNTVIPVWLEQARTPVFRLFTPDLNPASWRLIIAKIEVSFAKETVYGHPVAIRTYVDHVGNSSFRLGQEVWQQEEICAQGLSTMVHFDYERKQSVAVPDDIRQQLERHMRP